jgi:amino acid transporter
VSAPSIVPAASADQDSADAAQLATLGYRQRLTRTLGLFSNFAVGFTYLSPLVGVYSLFGYGLATGGPAFFWTIPIVMVGQLLVLLTFAEVASQYPIAGGVYQWAKRLVGPRYAWFSGWMYVWALLVTVASIAFPVATYAGPLLGFTPTYWTTVATALVVILVTTTVNLFGTRILALAARIGVAVEILGTVVLGLYLLLFHRNLSPGIILHTEGARSASGGYFGAFLAAALFAVWIFYGFEACGDIAEEVKDPSRKIPRAMGLTLGAGGLATVILTLGLIVAVPDLGAVMSGKDTTPVSTVLSTALGSGGSKFALALIVLGYASCTLAIQAAATRLVYSFGRDGMIVGGRRLARLHPRFHMPLGAAAVTGIVPAAIVFLPSATVNRIITFAVVGIYVGFQCVVLASVIARARGWRPGGAFRLGRWGWAVNIGGLFYGVAAMVVLSWKTPPLGDSFFDRWLVPISVAIIAAVGLLYMIILRPKENVAAEDRA